VIPGDWSKHLVAETPLGRLGTMGICIGGHLALKPELIE